MESLQLSQVLADLSNLGAAEPDAAAAIVRANVPIVKPEQTSATASNTTLPPRPHNPQRSWSTDLGGPPKFDKLGRRILSSNTASGVNSGTGTPRRGDSDLDDDLERASTLMALYDIRAKLKQQDNSSLMRAREKINALAARQHNQHSQPTGDRNMKTAEQLRRNRYSFPKAGL